MVAEIKTDIIIFKSVHAEFDKDLKRYVNVKPAQAAWDRTYTLNVTAGPTCDIPVLMTTLTYLLRILFY
jgi:hypothetical protein